MSITRIKAEVECDGCHAGWTIITEKMTQVRRKLRDIGWDVDTSRDFCGNCAAKRRQKPPEPPK